MFGPDATASTQPSIPHAQRLVGHMVDVVITEALSHTLRARVAVDVADHAVA